VKFRCERDALVEAFGSAARAVASRTAQPVLSGVRLELTGDSLHLTGTDLDLTIDVTTAAAGMVDGTCVIPARLGSDILRAVEPGAVTVTVDGDQAKIEAGRSVFTVRTLPIEDFPKLGAPSTGAVTLGAKELVDALKQVIPAASHDDARPILTGVLLAAEAGGLRLVATDSYRLAVRDLPGTSVLSEGQSVLVPGRALSELSRLAGSASEVTLRLGDREAAFEVSGVRLTTRLIEGSFPAYRNLIPASLPNTLSVGRQALLDALRRVRLLAKDATPIRLRMSSTGVELIAIAQDVGQATEDVEASYAGADLTVAFNPEFLVAGVELAQGDELTLQTTDALKQAVIRAVGREDYLYLLMPVRVS
jgi:DNA polymerase III subunit beta